ncbi:tRNA 4-thiouridine(8) synthase ThiI [Mycoplasmopsis citelli]|uniref:tRNA uracil 4-sulfurtransferase ThiI n=1 Tax=Mycoplasmopsis citelli TaxID=171281 RepID=UPI002114B64C|nr:tRNA uracil 4-sulfurtransferase ThiI [Mycoplasmopsis citelli]UUD35890.1 tRNA 4-thiouridine(8) synthase ThiI [Mycoplasmopsis citelli]
MYSKILIRYGELVLKKKNRKQFIEKLSNNIFKITGSKPEVEFDRMYLNYSEELMDKLQYVFGISSYSPVVVVENDFEKLKQAALLLVKKTSKTFKIAARRNYKKFEYKSDQINNLLGAYLLQNTALKVDVHFPDQIFYVEVRSKCTYIFSEYFDGLGGLPTGSNGKGLHLISGGFDSPVAAYLMMKRGVELQFLSFLTPPQTDAKTKEKILNLVGVLSKFQGQSTLYFADYSKLMNYISLVSKESYKINLMRRSFYRIANQLATQKNLLCISNGENLGQVASQTLESLNVISSVAEKVILRPLITYDKNEIINIAKKIQTHDISIIKANETCELFAPKAPVTRPLLQVAISLEEELSLINSLEMQLLDQGIEALQIKGKYH